MSKGTKQIRLGKVERFIKKLERQLVDIDAELEAGASGIWCNKKAEENRILNSVIIAMREEFDL